MKFHPKSKVNFAAESGPTNAKPAGLQLEAYIRYVLRQLNESPAHFRPQS